MTHSDDDKPGKRTQVVPVLPLRDIVVFPHKIVPLFVGREKSVRALEDVGLKKSRFSSSRRRMRRSTTPARTTSTASAPWPRSCSC
jgi:ATP-dependent Lon protease